MKPEREKQMTIHQKLGKVQSALFVPKGNRNNFGGYNYRSCEDILKQVKPLLAENGLALTMSSRMIQVGEWVYVDVTCTLFDNESSESVIVNAQAREPESRKGMDAAQVSGSSLSYARKYALAGMFGIDNEKDPDATNCHGNTPAPQKVAIEVDFTTCPLNDKRFFGKKWAEMDRDTLAKFLSMPEEQFPKLTAGHRNEIKKVLDTKSK